MLNTGMLLSNRSKIKLNIQSNPHNSNPRNSNFLYYNSNNVLWSRQICHTIPNKQTPVIRTPLIRTYYNSNYICWYIQEKYRIVRTFVLIIYFRPIFYKIPQKMACMSGCLTRICRYFENSLLAHPCPYHDLQPGI